MPENWFHIVDGAKAGPTSKEKLLAVLNKAADWREEYVWREGMTDWAKAGSVPELAVSPPPLPTARLDTSRIAPKAPNKPRSALAVALWIIATPVLLFVGWVVIFTISEAASDTETFAARSGLSVSECRDVAIKFGMRYDQANAQCYERLPKKR